MNLTKDPILRKRMLTMVEEIYDKAVIPVKKASSPNLTVAEKKAIDRCVVKYLETAQYVTHSFISALEALSQKDQPENQ